jgi:protein tyrosine phosphatase
VGWPDRKIPAPKHYKDLLTLINLLRLRRTTSPQSPVVIHCSAGIGRTGTLITLYYLLGIVDGQKREGRVVQASVFDTVRTLREQRAGCVQTLEQYQFIHTFMSLYLQNKLK